MFDLLFYEFSGTLSEFSVGLFCFNCKPNLKLSYCESSFKLISQHVLILLIFLDSKGTIISIGFNLVFFVEWFIVCRQFTVAKAWTELSFALDRSFFNQNGKVQLLS